MVYMKTLNKIKKFLNVYFAIVSTKISIFAVWF